MPRLHNVSSNLRPLNYLKISLTVSKPAGSMLVSADSKEVHPKAAKCIYQRTSFPPPFLAHDILQDYAALRALLLDVET